MNNIVQFPSKKPQMSPGDLDNKQRLKNWLVDYLKENKCTWETKDGILCGPEALAISIIESLFNNGWLNL